MADGVKANKFETATRNQMRTLMSVANLNPNWTIQTRSNYCTGSNTKTGNFTSGFVQTKNKAYFKYGYVEDS